MEMRQDIGFRQELSCTTCGKPITEREHHTDADDFLDVELSATTKPYNEHAEELRRQCPKCGKWGRPSIWAQHQRDHEEEPHGDG